MQVAERLKDIPSWPSSDNTAVIGASFKVKNQSIMLLNLQVTTVAQLYGQNT